VVLSPEDYHRALLGGEGDMEGKLSVDRCITKQEQGMEHEPLAPHDGARISPLSSTTTATSVASSSSSSSLDDAAASPPDTSSLEPAPLERTLPALALPLPSLALAITSLPIGHEADLAVGEDVVLLGYSKCPSRGGLPTATNTQGVYAGQYEDHLTGGWLRTTALMLAGQSGGPLLNSRGEVVGWNVRSKFDRVHQGVGYYPNGLNEVRPASELRNVLSSVLGGRPPQATITPGTHTLGAAQARDVAIAALKQALAMDTARKGPARRSAIQRSSSGSSSSSGGNSSSDEVDSSEDIEGAAEEGLRVGRRKVVMEEKEQQQEEEEEEEAEADTPSAERGLRGKATAADAGGDDRRERRSISPPCPNGRRAPHSHHSSRRAPHSPRRRSRSRSQTISVGLTSSYLDFSLRIRAPRFGSRTRAESRPEATHRGEEWQRGGGTDGGARDAEARGKEVEAREEAGKGRRGVPSSSRGDLNPSTTTRTRAPRTFISSGTAASTTAASPPNKEKRNLHKLS